MYGRHIEIKTDNKDTAFWVFRMGPLNNRLRGLIKDTK